MLTEIEHYLNGLSGNQQYYREHFELLKEQRAVLLLKRRRAPRNLSHLAQVRKQIAGLGVTATVVSVEASTAGHTWRTPSTAERKRSRPRWQPNAAAS